MKKYETPLNRVFARGRSKQSALRYCNIVTLNRECEIACTRASLRIGTVKLFLFGDAFD